MRMRTRLVRGIEQRVEPLLIHQRHEELAEAFSSGMKREDGGALLLAARAAGCRTERVLQPARPRRRHLARRDQVFDGQDLVAGAGAPGQVRRPAGRERAGGAAARVAVRLVEVGNCHVEDRRARRAHLADHLVHPRGDLAFAGDADEELPHHADAPAAQVARRPVEGRRERSTGLLAGSLGRLVLRIDPHKNQIVARIPLGDVAADGIVLSRGLLWVAAPPSA